MIARLRELLAAATPGPWEAADTDQCWVVYDGAGDRIANFTIRLSLADEKDAKLIAAAVNALPALLRVAEAAKAVIDEADPRIYGDLTEKQAALKQCLAALEGGTHE